MSSKNVRQDDAEVFVAKAVEKYFFIRYFFYLICALPGIAGFFLGWEKVVYASAIICILVYMFFAAIYGRVGMATTFLALAALVGFLVIERNMVGASMGVLIVFIIRHLIKELFFKFVRLLIEASKYAK